jgi:hypothetical protein
VLSERELIERAASRLIEVRRVTLERLVNLLIDNHFLTRDAVISEVDQRRLKAQYQVVARIGRARRTKLSGGMMRWCNPSATCCFICASSVVPM